MTDKKGPSIEDVERWVDEAFEPIVQQYWSRERWRKEACVVLDILIKLGIDAEVWRWPTDDDPAIQLVVTDPAYVKRADQVANAVAGEAKFAVADTAPEHPRFRFEPGCKGLFRAP